MNIDNLTLGEIKSLKKMFTNESNETEFKIGEKYFIRTVTMHHVGKLKKINDRELVLENASWIADSGRFHDALKNGKLNEVEPFVDDVIVMRDSIIDATIWRHELPLCQK